MPVPHAPDFTTPIALMLGLLALPGCVSVQNPQGMGSRDIGESKGFQPIGLGIESRDTDLMAKQMVESMLREPSLVNAARPPQVIIDASAFTNESSQRMNMNSITDKLVVALSKAAHGRMVFVSRESMGRVDAERAMRRSGRVDQATVGMSRAQAGADYRLEGRMTSDDDPMDMRTGVRMRGTHILFKMVDMERGTQVWADDYATTRMAADSVMYR